MGDLPDTFSVKKEDGAKVNFPFFITNALVHANGKRVDVYYMLSEINTVKEILLVKK